MVISKKSIKSLYKKGDIPGNWNECPMGRIARENGLMPTDTRCRAVVASVLGMTTDWVDGYLTGFDACAVLDVNLSYYIISSHPRAWWDGLTIGLNDRTLYGQDKKAEMPDAS